MSNIILPASTALTTYGANTGASTGTAVSTASWTEIVASVPAPGWSGFTIVAESDDQFVLKIAQAAAASEDSNVIVDGAAMVQASGGAATFFVPIAVPAGARLAAKSLLDAGNVEIIGHIGGEPEGSLIVQYGFSSGTGQLVTPDATSHTKGSYSELVSSTARDIVCFWVTIFLHTTVDTNINWLVDLAIGGAGSEVVIASNFAGRRDAADLYAPYAFRIDRFVPAGSRISMRCQADNLVALRAVIQALYA